MQDEAFLMKPTRRVLKRGFSPVKEHIVNLATLHRIQHRIYPTILSGYERQVKWKEMISPAKNSSRQ